MNIRERESLTSYNTFGIESTARYFAPFTTEDELKESLQFGKNKGLPLLVLGGGSNVLFTRDVDGLVLRNEIGGIDVVQEDEEHLYIRTGGGENWHRFVMYCVERGYAGIENLALIPGSNGASPMQNIGAYGVEIKDVFHQLEAIHIHDLSKRTFSNEECAFGYRESVFKHQLKGQYVITSVTYRLNRKPQFNTSYGAIQQELEAMGVSGLSIGAIAQAVINIRSSKLPNPAEVGNAGSFFKNPQVPNEQFAALKAQYPGMPSFPVNSQFTKIPAGWLIEQCGWKGYREGDAGCYPKQALVLVNYGRAGGQQIYDLSQQILDSVKARFGIELEREVNVV